MAYYGKQKCKILKQIRAEIAKNNDIAYTIEECKHQGNCLGTCPKCESEVRYLEQQLEARKKAGKVVLLAGIAAGMSLAVTGCTPEDKPLAGDLAVNPIETATENPDTTTSDETVDITVGEIALPDETLPEEDPLSGDIAILPDETDESKYVLDGDISVPETTAPDVYIDIEGMMVAPDDNNN